MKEEGRKNEKEKLENFKRKEKYDEVADHLKEKCNNVEREEKRKVISIKRANKKERKRNVNKKD